MHWLAKVVVLASVKRLWSLKRSYLTKPSYLAFHYVVARGEVCRRYRSTLDWANRWSTRLNVVCNVRWSFVETHDLVSNACTGNVHFSWNDWQSHCVLAGKSVNVFAHTRLACEGSYLVDPASSHMLVSKTKPCMSKFKRFKRWDCGRLIISVIVYLMVDYYKDNRRNSRANTCTSNWFFSCTY